MGRGTGHGSSKRSATRGQQIASKGVEETLTHLIFLFLLAPEESEAQVREDVLDASKFVDEATYDLCSAAAQERFELWIAQHPRTLLVAGD